MGRVVFDLAFSPDGKTLVSAGWDAPLQVWDLTTGKEVRRLGTDTDVLRYPAFSPDGKTLAASDGNIIRLWDTANWAEDDPLIGHEESIFHLSFSSDGKRLIVGDCGGTVYQWTLALRVWQVTRTERRFGRRGWLSPDGRQIACGESFDLPLLLRDVETGKNRELIELGEKAEYFPDLRWSPDGKILAVASRGIRIRCLEAATGKELMRFGDPNEEFKRLAFSPDGKRLAVACGHGVRLWEVATGRELTTSGTTFCGINAIAFSPDGRQLLSADGAWIRSWDRATLRKRWCIAEAGLATYRFAFSPDSKQVAAEHESRIRFLDTSLGRETHVWGKGNVTDDSRTHIELGRTAPDLKTVISWHNRRSLPPADVHITDAATGEERFTFQRTVQFATPTGAADVSPDGRYLALGSCRAPIRIYRLTTGKELACVELSDTGWDGLTFAPDGRTLVAGDGKGNVRAAGSGHG